MPSGNKDMIGGHVRNYEPGDVNLNAFQKAIDNQRNRTPGVTVFTRFGQNVIEYKFSKDLSSESEFVHLLIPH